MKKMLLKSAAAFLLLLATDSVYAQTPGNLSFTFTTTSHSGYQGTRNVMAVWIQDNAGAFVKTKLRYAGGNTADHLPTWAVNSGGSSSNCLSGSCNIVSATTGSTLPGATTKTITWDGTNTAGTLLPNGVYKVTIQQTWDHGSSGTTTRSFTFTKGATADNQSPTADANFTTMSLSWTPTSGAGIEENQNELAGVNVYPNPSSNGIFNVDYLKANNIKVINLQGVVISNEDLDVESGTKSVNLSEMSNGVYFIQVTDGVKSTKIKVTLNK
jgi:hypothetical protein